MEYILLVSLKKIFSWCLLVALTFLAVANVFAAEVVKTTAFNQPNIILIMADDVSPDIFGAYGQSNAAKTPNIDRLAKQGVMFKTAYATAMCGPSRAQIMTGRYANTTGAYHNMVWLNDSHKRLYKDNLAFAKVLKQAGYATAIAGKWHAGKQMPYEAEVGFDEYSLWEMDHYINALPGGAKFTGLHEDKKTTSRYWHPAYVENGKLLNTKADDFGPDIEANFLMDFIERKSKAKQPFLAYWPTVAPHGSRQGFPSTPHNGKVGFLGQRKDKKAEWQRFLALNEYLDHLVGKVLQKVEDLGISDNTIIIFTSDNGTAGKAKTRGVEKGVQVAHIVAGAGIKQRGLSDELTDFADIMPTLIDFANAQSYLPADYHFDGQSLKPYLTGKTDSHRPWIYGYISGSQILRTKDYLLEVVNPILGTPKGRLYKTGDSRWGQGYQLVSGQAEHAQAANKFAEILQQYPPLTTDLSYFNSKRGKQFLKQYLKPKNIKRHLHNHKDYQFYDESYVE